MAGSDLTGLLLVGGLLIGGVYLIQNPQILQGLGGGGMAPPMEEPAPAEEEGPPADEPPADEEPEPEPVAAEPDPIIQYVPYPVPVHPPSRSQICSDYFGGSCRKECEQYGFSSSICQDCINYCGPPRRRYSPPPQRPRPRPIPHCGPGTRWDNQAGKCVKIYGGPGPTRGTDCPRGQRFDWTKRKCMPVPKPPHEQPPKPEPTPKPTPKPSPSPSPVAAEPSAPPAPATSNYASYYGGCSCGGSY